MSRLIAFHADAAVRVRMQTEFRRGCMHGGLRQAALTATLPYATQAREVETTKLWIITSRAKWLNIPKGHVALLRAANASSIEAKLFTAVICCYVTAVASWRTAPCRLLHFA